MSIQSYTNNSKKFNVLSAKHYPIKKYVHKNPGYKCITKLYVRTTPDESKLTTQFKIIVNIIFTRLENKRQKKCYKSTWLNYGEQLNDDYENIIMFVGVTKQITKAIFDYNMLYGPYSQDNINHCTTKVTHRYYLSNSYKKYYTSINNGESFKKKFSGYERREFWLTISKDLIYTIQNVRCKLPSTKLDILHTFNLEDWHDIKSMILRREYPISNLYKWSIDKVLNYSFPILLEVLKRNTFIYEPICKIIIFYMFI